MNPYVLPKDKTGMMYQIGMSGALVLLACVLLTRFLGRIGNIAPITGGVLTTVTWIVLPGAWAIVSLQEYMAAEKTSYVLLQGSLIVRKQGLFGRSSEYLYRYDAIWSINSSSSRDDSYGTITLHVDQQDAIVLHNIAQPSAQAAIIKQLVNASRRH